MYNLRQQFLTHVAQTSDSPLMLEVNKAEGVFLFGQNQQKYFDLISGISVSNVGHSHPRVVEAVQRQAADYMHLMVYGEFIQQPQVKLAATLAQMLPQSLSSCYFVNSGSEAVEGALKLAKRYTGRTELVAFDKAYHGSTHGSLSVMGEEAFKRSFRPLLPDIRHIPFNDISALKQITTRTAAVIIEPIQGEAGVRVAGNSFIDALRKRCSEVGALLIFDEIQTGMGRTGKMFAFEHYGIVPDILLLAKALGGGMPLGAFIGSPDVMQALTNDPPLGHITTFGGHPVSCAASLAAIDVITDNRLVEQVEAKEDIFRKTLANHPLVSSIRSKGLIMALELGSFDRVNALIHYGVDHGFIVDWFLFCNTAVRIAPPLTISEQQCHEAAELILNGLNAIA